MMMKGLLHSCAHCGVAAEKSYRCSGCKQVTYCSKACQRGDWPEHKIQCESVEEALLAKSGEGDRNVGAQRRARRWAAALQALVALAWLLGATGALTVVDRCAGKLLALAGATVGRSGPVTLWSLGLLVASIIARSAAGQALLRRAKILASAGVAVYELRGAQRRRAASRYASARARGPRRAAGRRRRPAPFAALDETAAAGASVAQVALKLARPGVDVLFEADLRLLYFLVWLATEFFETDLRYLRASAASYASACRRELDFRREEANARDLRESLESLPGGGVSLPEILPQYTRRTMLVMSFAVSFEAGFRVDDVGELEEHKIAKAAVFRRLAAALAHGIFAEGLFHGDPHAGDVLVRPNPEQADGFDLVLLDGGAVERLDDDVRAAFAGCAYGTATQDPSFLRASLDALIAAAGLGADDGTRKALMRVFVFLLHDPASGAGAAARRRANVKHPSPLLGDDGRALPESLVAVLRAASVLRGLAAALDVASCFAEEVCKACVRGLPAARDLEHWKLGTGYAGPTVRKAPAKRSLHRAAASMRRSAPSFSDVPPLCPASPPGAAARPADDTGFFVVRGRRVSGLEWIEPEPGQPDEDDDDDEGDFDDMSSFDSVFDSELLEAL
ncbi:hypothetical protein JL721_5411 [Aureococcus anophagefferens]|nr:hypothetical protein JL721_5411 [Aureococcus anophagefferens]